MTPKPITAKQWQRRAEVAEAHLASIQEMRRFDKDREMMFARQNARLTVALREAGDAIQWALQEIEK